MINNEILIKKSAVQMAIMTLKMLKTGTIYREMYPDMALMKTSISETSDA